MNDVSRPIRLQHADKLFIGGRWVDPQDGGRLEVISPHTEELAARVAEAREADMDLAVAAARHAFDEGPWPRMSPQERGGYLKRLADALRPRAPELQHAWSTQVGAVQMMAPGMIGGAMASLEFYVDQAGRYGFATEHRAFDGHGVAVVAREPVGVAVAIVPWNAPFLIMINKVAPALLAGCPVIMKPSPETPLDAHLIAEAAEEAGLPPGVVNLVPAHREASDFLVRNRGVDKVSFTGSTAAGRRIASVCGERIARVTLELGGKSAAIVLDDADIEATARHLAFVISIFSGQVCATLSRVIVSRARYGAFAEALKAALEEIKVGDPFDPTSQMGPLAMRRQLERVEGYVRKGLAEGARIATGGGRPKAFERGCWFEPTLFTDVESGMTIAQEEIFGPVITLLASDDEADAVRIANDSSYGLFGAVFTQDAERAWRIARQVRTGAITQNGFRMDTILPFGGFKQSGIGREGGLAGLESFTETKTILLDGRPAAL
jgi:acyl-CoA reductase-like NAD-dependent aldehyde dehydrogenase